MTIPEWRSMGVGDKSVFLAEVRDSLYKRWEVGREKYRSDIHGFQGDPLEHAWEETLDQLFYIYMARRERRLEDA